MYMYIIHVATLFMYMYMYRDAKPHAQNPSRLP